MTAKTRMLTLLCACFLLGSTAASIESGVSYGDNGDNAFSFSDGQQHGPITAIRIREGPSCLNGIHFKFGTYWAPFSGDHGGVFQEFLLHSNENIIQVSGKFSNCVNELLFVTNFGRIFKVGQPSGTSFNDFPKTKGNVLLYISGRYSNVLNSIRFHWGVHPNK
ncbi:zymogen granule membrane protein 16-like [Aquarana catesbeiana]|uniref:zymogen granule membrane protein 16-like n=1 Tax=Aquarana catesbeiana TaxID=8400 RepID=UPI003CCA2C6D